MQYSRRRGQYAKRDTTVSGWFQPGKSDVRGVRDVLSVLSVLCNDVCFKS